MTTLPPTQTDTQLENLHMGRSSVTILDNLGGRHRRSLGAASVACLVGAVVCLAAPARAADVEHEAWRAAIEKTPVPAEGCFEASFPETAWKQVTCASVKLRPFLPKHGRRSRTVGNGNDYAAVSSTLTSQAVGTFPTVTGVKTEKDSGESNDYTLQLNSNFMTTAGCNGSTNSSCQTWLQYVYSSGEQAAFMQYWLINYGNKCPAGGGWSAYQGSCYKNSSEVSVPQLAISGLSGFKLTGKAVKGGSDTLTFTTSTKAYSTSGKDSVVYLATAWTGSEFNIIGDGGGSEAVFNSGSSITVKIALTDGSTAAPTCEADDGTTGETNNLNLKNCTVAGGSTPSISFVESN
jgi:hypothetical protein